MMMAKNTFFSKLSVLVHVRVGRTRGLKNRVKPNTWGSGSPNASSYEHPSSAKLSLHEDKDVPQKKEWKSKVETIYVTIKLGMNIRTRIKQSSYK